MGRLCFPHLATHTPHTLPHLTSVHMCHCVSVCPSFPSPRSPGFPPLNTPPYTPPCATHPQHTCPLTLLRTLPHSPPHTPLCTTLQSITHVKVLELPGPPPSSKCLSSLPFILAGAASLVLRKPAWFIHMLCSRQAKSWVESMTGTWSSHSQTLHEEARELLCGAAVVVLYIRDSKFFEVKDLRRTVMKGAY